MHRRLITRWVAVVLLAALLPLTASCYGRFQLVRNVYDANTRVKDKYARSAFTLLLLAVYGVAGVVDFLVINPMEFWQGKNPMRGESDPVIRTAQIGADRFVQTIRHQDGATEVTVERFRDGALVDRLTLRQPDGSDGLSGSLHVPGAPATTLLVEREGDTLVLTRTVAGEAPERSTATSAEIRSLEERRLAALGPAGPTPLAGVSHP